MSNVSKNINVFTYFVEPASYTIDLINNVYNKLNLETEHQGILGKKIMLRYAFIQQFSKARSKVNIDSYEFLSKKSLLSKFFFIYNVFRNNDLIIINGYNNYCFILTFLFNFFSFNKRYIGIETHTQLKTKQSTFIKKIIKKIYLNVIFRSKYVYGLSGGSYSHQDLFHEYGMDKQNIFLLPMVVDNNKFYKHIHHKKNNIFTYLYVGRLLETKNVNILCERFLSSLSKKKARLIIVGSGELLDSYKMKYSHPKIEFRGSLYGNDLVNVYHQSSVFVFPSTDESWGLVLNEAMSAGLPVIAHNEVGAIHDLVVGRETGFVINNWNDLEDQMLKLYDDKNLCRNLSFNAVNLMKDYWNYTLYEKSFLRFIRALI